MLSPLSTAEWTDVYVFVSVLGSCVRIRFHLQVEVSTRPPTIPDRVIHSLSLIT